MCRSVLGEEIKKKMVYSCQSVSLNFTPWAGYVPVLDMALDMLEVYWDRYSLKDSKVRTED